MHLLKIKPATMRLIFSDVKTKFGFNYNYHI